MLDAAPVFGTVSDYDVLTGDTMKLSEIEVGAAYRMRAGGLFIPLGKSEQKRGSFDGAQREPFTKQWAPAFGVHLSAFEESDAAASMREESIREGARRFREQQREALLRRWGNVYTLARQAFGAKRVELDESFGEAWVSIEPLSKLESLRLVAAVTRRLGHLPSDPYAMDEVGRDALLVLAGLDVSDGLGEAVRLSGDAELTALEAVLVGDDLEELVERIPRCCI